MSDPKRLLDELEGDSGAARLLASGVDDAPSRASRARIAGALGLAVTAAASSSAGAGAIAGSAGTKTTSAGILGLLGTKGVWIASVLGLAALSGGLVYVTRPRPPAPPAGTTALQANAPPLPSALPDPIVSAPVASVSSADMSGADPVVAPAPTSSSANRVAPSNAPKPSSAVSSSTPTDVAEELRLVDEARKALRGGNPTACLAALRTYDATYPHGVLTPEANVLRAEALVRSGRLKEGQALATRLLQATPSGPHASRLRKLLEAEDATTP